MRSVRLCLTMQRPTGRAKGRTVLADTAKEQAPGGIEVRIEAGLILQFLIAVTLSVMLAVNGRDYFTDGGDFGDLASSTIYILLLMALPLFGPLLLLSLPVYLFGILRVRSMDRAARVVGTLLMAPLPAATLWIYTAYWKGMIGAVGHWAPLLCVAIVAAPAASFLLPRRKVVGGPR